MTGFVHPEFLIDTAELERRPGAPDLRVLDCTTHLIPDLKITYQVVPGREDFEKGHIPGAQFVDLQADELRRRFAAVGAFDREVITYCGGGIAASADAFALTLLGHPDVRLYDASLSEWAIDPSLPMETG